MADLAPYLGMLGTLVTVVGGPAMNAVVQNHRTQRLRNSITDNIKLRKEMEEGSSFVAAEQEAELDELVREQMTELFRRERAWLHRKRDWSSFGIVVLLLTVGTPLLIWLWAIEGWWGRALFWLLAFFLLAMSVTGIHATINPSNKKSENSEPPAQEAASHDARVSNTTF